MDETEQIVLPPDVTLVMMFGAYICLGRKTDDRDTPAKLSAKRSSGNLKLVAIYWDITRHEMIHHSQRRKPLSLSEDISSRGRLP
jgi:hypothetical protein